MTLIKRKTATPNVYSGHSKIFQWLLILGALENVQSVSQLGCSPIVLVHSIDV